MISQTIRGFAFAALPCLFAACSMNNTPQTPGELGRQFAATVPGTWSCQIKDGGIDSRMIKQFSPDGSARGVLLAKKKSGGVSFVLPEIPFTSRWRIAGDVVETYDIKTGVPGLFKPGKVIRDTILYVSPNRIVSRSIDSGEIEVITRLKSER